jgi:hypothetical protein
VNSITYSLNIPALKFSSTSDYSIIGTAITIISEKRAWLRAAVDLPEGAIIKNFQVFVYDNNPTYDIELEAYLKTRNGDKSYEYPISTIIAKTEGSSEKVRMYEEDFPFVYRVNNKINMYSIFIVYEQCIATIGDQHLRFFGCRILYTMG